MSKPIRRQSAAPARPPLASALSDGHSLSPDPAPTARRIGAPREPATPLPLACKIRPFRPVWNEGTREADTRSCGSIQSTLPLGGAPICPVAWPGRSPRPFVQQGQSHDTTNLRPLRCLFAAPRHLQVGRPTPPGACSPPLRRRQALKGTRPERARRLTESWRATGLDQPNMSEVMPAYQPTLSS